MRKRLNILILLCVLLPGLGRAASLSLSLERDTASLGEGLQLSVRLEGGRATSEPRIAGLDAFRVNRAGRSSSTQIVGGRLSSATEFYYYLEPLRPGHYALGPARLGNLVSNTVGLRVSDAAEQSAGPPLQPREPLSLTAGLNKTSCYEGERLDYVLRLATRMRVSDLNVSLPPQLDLRQEGEPRQSERDGQTIFELRYSFKPKRPGRYRIAPAAMNLRAYVQTDPFFAAARPVSLRSQGLELTVKPLPVPPAAFSGQVGTYTVKAALQPERLKPGEAATYSLVISGAGNLPELKPAAVPGLKFYPDKPVEQAGAKTLNFAVVAERPGLYRLSCPALSYFDPASGTYKRLSPALQTLTVVGTASASPVKPAPRAAPRPEVQPAEDILPIHVFARKPLAAAPALYLLLLALTAYLLLALLRRFSFSRPREPKPLKAFKFSLKQDSSRARALEALLAYFKAVLGVSVTSSAELTAELERRGLPPQLSAEIAARLDELNQAVYTGQGAAPVEPGLARLLGRLDRELK